MDYPQHVTLGDEVLDTISGYRGTATARYSYLYGCERINVERIDKDGKPEDVAFDEQRLTVIREPAQPIPVASIGGPRDDPQATRPAP